MLIRYASAFLLASIVALGLTMGAHANPRFAVENTLDETVDVVIFNGDDSYCGTPAKSKKVKAGERESFGCTGNGKGKCKIVLGIDGQQICKSDRNTCSKNAIKIDGGSSVTIAKNENGKTVCAFE